MRCAGRHCTDEAVVVIDRGTVQQLACAVCALGVVLFAGGGGPRPRFAWIRRPARIPECRGA